MIRALAANGKSWSFIACDSLANRWVTRSGFYGFRAKIIVCLLTKITEVPYLMIVSIQYSMEWSRKCPIVFFTSTIWRPVSRLVAEANWKATPGSQGVRWWDQSASACYHVTAIPASCPKHPWGWDLDFPDPFSLGQLLRILFFENLTAAVIEFLWPFSITFFAKLTHELFDCGLIFVYRVQIYLLLVVMEI